MLEAQEALTVTEAVVEALTTPINRGGLIALTPSRLGLGDDEWTEEEQFVLDRLVSAFTRVSEAELAASRFRHEEREFRSGIFEGVSVYLREAEEGGLVMYLAPSDYQF